MTKLQTIALYVIALILLADFVIEHVRPALVLAIKEEAYLTAARTCHESMANWQEAKDASVGLDRETAFALERSGDVGLMACYEQEVLRRFLLGQGIKGHDLGRIDLRAINESKAGLSYFVRGITGEK